MYQVMAYLRRLIFPGENGQRNEAGEPCRKRACSDDLTGAHGQETSDKSCDQLAGSPRVPCNKKAKHDAPAGQDQESSSDTSDSSSDTPKQSGNERGEASKIQNEDNPRSRAGNRSSKRSRLRSPERDTSTEIQEPDTETIIHYKCNNFYFTQSPLTLGDSTGNAYNYDVSAKFYRIKEGRRDEGQTRSLLEIIRRHVEANEPEVTSLRDICRECDAATIGVEKGCVKVTFRFDSKEGLQRFWAKYSSGELQQRLKADLPIRKVEMSADDYASGCEFFEESGKRSQKAQESNEPDLAASLDTVEYYIAEYVRHRNATLKLLRAYAQDYGNPWKEIAKVFGPLVLPVLWVGVLACGISSCMYLYNDILHASPMTSDTPTTPEPRDEETSIAVYGQFFCVVYLSMTFSTFYMSHGYISSALGFSVIIAIMTIAFWVLSLSFMEWIEVLVFVAIFSIAPIFVSLFSNAQYDDGDGLKSGLRNLPTNETSVLKVFLGLWSTIIVFSVAYFVGVKMSLYLVCVVIIAWFSYHVTGQPFTDARTVLMQEIKATLEPQSALHNVNPQVFLRLWLTIIVFSVAYFVSVTMSLYLVGVVALAWFSYRVTEQPFTDARTVVMQDIKATLELQSALHNVKRKTPLTWQGRLRSAKHGAKRRFVDTTVLKTVVEEKSLQLSDTWASGISVLESVVSASKKKSNFLFSIIHLPEDILESISSAIRIHKIPNSQVGKFIEDVANNLECLNEKEMKIQIDRLREEVGVL